MNTLKRKSPANTNRPPLQVSAPDIAQKMEMDFQAQLSRDFAEEMSDAESRNTLKAAFFLGVRLCAARMAESMCAPSIQAAESLYKNALAARQNGTPEAVGGNPGQP